MEQICRYVIGSYLFTNVCTYHMNPNIFAYPNCATFFQVMMFIYRLAFLPLYHTTKTPWELFPVLRWRQNEHDGVLNHQPYHCKLSRLFRRRSKKTSKLRVTSLCAGNSPETGEFPTQRASNAENVSIWCRHHVFFCRSVMPTFDITFVVCLKHSVDQM